MEKLLHTLKKKPIISSFDIEDEDMYNIKTNDITKAHVQGEVSIIIFKLCDKSIAKLLCIIFKNCKLKKMVHNPWKKANVAPVYKKEKKIF